MVSLLVSVLLAASLPASPDTVFLTLDKAVETALSENVSVKVADREIRRAEYARKGSYAALFPSLDASASYQRTIEKQVMYMDGDSFDFGSIITGALAGYLSPLYGFHGLNFQEILEQQQQAAAGTAASSDEGISVGRWNTWSAGVSMGMPLVNAQLWKSIRISGEEVELAVEKARSSRLETVNQVKQAYFGVLLAKAAHSVYQDVYDNALQNFNLTKQKYDAGRASDLDMARSATTLAAAVPNVYDSGNAVTLALWQLKAVMGVDLDMAVDVCESFDDYVQEMMSGWEFAEDPGVENNSSLRQLAIQAEELHNNIKLQQYANLPTLSLGVSYMYNAMTNDFKFSEYKWTPYSYAGLSLSIPIFAGGRRSSAIKQSRVQAEELDLQRANAERQLKIAIRQSIGSMDTAVKSYDSALAAREAAQKAYDITAESYAVGRSTVTDLNDAQLALTQAKLAVSQSVYAFVVAKASLEQTIGRDYTNE